MEFAGLTVDLDDDAGGTDGVVDVGMAALGRLGIALRRGELRHEHAGADDGPAAVGAIVRLEPVDHEVAQRQLEAGVGAAVDRLVAEEERILFVAVDAVNDLEDLLASLHRRRFHGLTAPPGHVGGNRLPLVGVAVGIGGLDADLLRWHRQHFGDDLRHHGQVPLTEFHARHGHVHRSVLVELEERGRRGIGRHRRGLPHQRHTLAGGDVGVVRSLFGAPLDGVGDTVDALQQTRGVHLLAVCERVTFDDGVLAPELDRVHPELPCDAVHVRFETEVELRVAEAPVGPARRQVGVDAQRVDLDVRDPVGAGRREPGRVDDVGAVLDVGAGIPVHGVVDGRDRPVVHDADLEPRLQALPLIGVVELLLSGEPELDRVPLHRRGERGSHDLHRYARLASESAADVGGHHPDLLMGQTEWGERFGDHVPLGVRRL